MNRILTAVLSFTAASLTGCVEEKKMETVPTVTAVEYDVTKTNPPSLAVKATGEVKSLGYSEPKLTRVTYVKPPADGVQDYHLTAVPPAGPAGQAITEVSAEDAWPNFETSAPWLKGVRVKGVGTGEKLVWIKADAVLKDGDDTIKAKVGQIVEVPVQYPVVPPFPSDFEVKIAGKKVPHSESSAPVLIDGKTVVGSSLILVRFPVMAKGSHVATIQYQRNGAMKVEMKLDVSE